MYIVAWYVYYYMFSALCFLSPTFSIVPHSCFWTVFKICIVSWGCPNCQCQFYKEFLMQFCLSAFLRVTLLVTHFLFKYNELILTVSMSSPWESGPISISTSCTVQFILILHTFLNSPILLHVAHIFPYAGHCLGVRPPPQYLHGCLWCVVVFILYPRYFLLWCIFNFIKCLSFCDVI